MAIVTTYGDPDKPAYTLQPEGWYDLKIVSAEMGASKNKGTPQLVCKAELVSEDQGRVAPGTQFTLYQSSSDKSAPFIARFLDAAGVQYEKRGNPASIVWDTDHIVGRHIRGQLTHGTWNGKPKEEWSNWCRSRYAGQQAPQQGGFAPAPGYAPTPQAAPQYAQPPQGYAQPGYAPSPGVAPGMPPMPPGYGPPR
jgi:hypothetical protein